MEVDVDAEAEPALEGENDGIAHVNVSAIGLRSGLAKDISAAIENSEMASSPPQQSRLQSRLQQEEETKQQKHEAQDLARRTQVLKQRAAEQAPAIESKKRRR